MSLYARPDISLALKEAADALLLCEIFKGSAAIVVALTESLEEVCRCILSTLLN